MKYQIKYKIWIEADGESFLGQGKIALLKSIHELGSLNKAAKQLNMSYKKAWDLIQSVNKATDKAILLSATGGKGGGGMVLTPYGEQIIKRFDSIDKKTRAFLNKQTINKNDVI